MTLKLKLPSQVIIIDTETGGLNADDEITWSLVKSRHAVGAKITGTVTKLAAPILEIGAVLLSQIDLKELDSFHCICGPEKDENFNEFIKKCTPKALEINGFNERKEELMKAKPLSEGLKDLIHWIKEKTNGNFIPGGQNVRYDIDMINTACQRYGINFQIKKQPIDLIPYAQLYFALRDTETVANYRLSTVAEALGIDTTNAHTALADVRMTAACLRKMFMRFAAS